MKHLLGKWCALFALLLLSVSGCQSSPPPLPLSTPSPTAPKTATVGSGQVSEERFRVEIALTGPDGRAGLSTYIGAAPNVQVAFRPMKDVISTKTDGSVSRYSTDWKTNNVQDMRYCAGLDGSCKLPEEWVPFVAAQTVRVNIDWLGNQSWGVMAQFRDHSGKLVPAGNTGSDVGTNTIVISSEINDSTPVSAHPPAYQTKIAQARAAFPVTGSVKINEGMPMGGKIGVVLQIPVNFKAASPAGQVIEMRTKTDLSGRCLAPEQMQDAVWQPFKDKLTIAHSITAINWTSFKLHVQYKDSKGNLSTVYCDDIGIEGSP